MVIKVANLTAMLWISLTMAHGSTPIQLSGALPISVDNSENDYFRPIVSQRGETCGNVAGIAYMFTYEMNAARNLSSKDIENDCYPYIYMYHFLNDGYAGGANPMGGKNMSSTIEIGLDISDCIDSIGGTARAKYFLIVDSKANSGSVDSLSVMDYTGMTVRETPSTISNPSISTGKNYYGIAATLTGIAVRRTHEASGTGRVKSYPNGTIGIDLPFRGEKIVSLFDITGKRCFYRVTGDQKEMIDLSPGLAKGTYIIQVQRKGDHAFVVNTNVVR
jgi:hypothetical protein